MKTVAKINPEEEYERAKKLIEAGVWKNPVEATDLDKSVDNLITAARVLMEREDLRRGKKKTPKTNKPKGKGKGETQKGTKKLPSERFPNLEIKEEVIKEEHPPLCPCCNEVMKESGLFDTSEKLEIIPKQYYIQRSKRVKYNCSTCHGSMKNTPAKASIVPAIGKRVLCKKLPIIISSDAHKPPTTAAFSQISSILFTLLTLVFSNMKVSR